MSSMVTLEIEDGLATMRMSRGHGNAINGDLVDALRGACEEAESNPDIRGVLLAAEGKLFCPGLDLQELIELDRPEMEDFLGRFSDCLLDLYTFPKPMVAAIHSHAVAGGCVLTLTADWRVLRENALVGLAEVRVGVPFPFGVAMILRESVPSPKIEEVALFGRNYTNREALSAGLVHEVAPAETFAEQCRQRLEEFASKDLRAFSVTKRYLRSATVERIHVHDRALQPEFLDAWFAPSTQKRLRQIVAELRGQGD